VQRKCFGISPRSAPDTIDDSPRFNFFLFEPVSPRKGITILPVVAKEERDTEQDVLADNEPAGKSGPDTFPSYSFRVISD